MNDDPTLILFLLFLFGGLIVAFIAIVAMASRGRGGSRIPAIMPDEGEQQVDQLAAQQAARQEMIDTQEFAAAVERAKLERELEGKDDVYRQKHFVPEVVDQSGDLFSGSDRSPVRGGRFRRGWR